MSAPIPSVARADQVRFPALAGVILFGAGMLMLVCLALPVATRPYFMRVLGGGFAALTVWAFLHRAARREPEWRFFLLFAIALALHGVWAGLKLLPQGWAWLRSPAHPGYVALQILGPVLQAAAILSWPSVRDSKALRWRQVLDGMIFTSSLFLVFWLLGLGPLLASSSLPAPVKASQLVFFLDYTLLLAVILYRGLDAPGRFHGPLGWALSASLCIVLGNLTWVWLQVHGRSATGHPLEILEILIHTLFLLTALAPAFRDPRGRPGEGDAAYLLEPYLPLFLAVPLGGYSLLKGSHPGSAVVIWLGLGMILLVLIRQLVALWDLRHFAASLEATVEERTGALIELQSTQLRNQKLNLLATLGAGLAHDLNNLLSVVRLTSTMLQEDLAEGRSPDPKDLERLQRVADKASGLAMNLMAYGRQGDPQPQVFDLNSKLRAMEQLVENLATRPVRVSWSLAAETLLLELDPLYIEQIMVNLVTNARDAMPQGGQLQVSTRLLGAGVGAQALLEVRDDGTGIPPEHLLRMFEPFFTTKEAGKGTGLGLASMKAIADDCGAEIGVASEMGQGTTFSLRFPLVAG